MAWSFKSDSKNILTEAVEQHYTTSLNLEPRGDKVITIIVIRPLDERTYCARSAFTHFGLWRNLPHYSWHHFRTRKCLIKRAQLTFSPISNRLAAIRKRVMSAVTIPCPKSCIRMVVVPEEDHGNYGEKTSTVVVAAHHRRQKSMSDHNSGGVCRSTPQRRLGVTGINQLGSYLLPVGWRRVVFDVTATRLTDVSADCRQLLLHLICSENDWLTTMTTTFGRNSDRR